MVLTRGQRNLLEKVYFNPTQAASFSSAQSLRKHLLSQKRPIKQGQQIKVPTVKDIQLWLMEKRAYTAHRPLRKKYPMKKVIVGGVNIQLQMDLVDMQQWSAENDGYRYILLAVDCFSRYAFSRPLKTKQGPVVALAIKEILDEAESRIDRKIKKIQADQGKEFYNKHVRELIETRYIQLFSTSSPTKAQMVERLIRTIRLRQERFNTFRGKRRWIESFPKLVKSYNHTIHSTLPKDMTPSQVNLKNERKVWLHLYQNEFSTPHKLEKTLNVGQAVRISKQKKTFEKSYYQNYTDEIFLILHVSKTNRPVTYRLTDSSGETIEGIFYRRELSPVYIDNKNIYAIEKVLNEEQRKDGKYLLVKWKGYPESQNEWIKAQHFASIRQAT